VSETRESLLFGAIMDVVHGVDLYSTLDRIVAAATHLSHAKYGALGILNAEGNVEEFLHFGMDPEDVAKMDHPPRGRGILGLLISHPHSVRLDDLSKHPASFGFPEGHPPMKSFLGVPVRVRGVIFGNLYLTEKQGSAEFTQEDEDLVTMLAAAAGLAIENAKVSTQEQMLALYEDRNRIARDLHDLVIQSLFATGMQLEAIARRGQIPEDETVRIRSAADELDKAIKISLRRQVMHEVEAYAPLLGSTPSITFEGAVDSLTTDRVAEQLVAVLRELLSNAMRHAKATELSVVVQRADGHIVLTVIDNGVGIPPNARHSGLDNLRKRAEALNGTFEVSSASDVGTVASWAVPVQTKS
jgi:signal transduction histidine kinase